MNNSGSEKVEKNATKAILLVDHGSVREEANETLVEVARLVEAKAPEHHVRVAHMELAEPTIEQGFAACVAAGAREVTILPYMLSPGRHSVQDIPQLANEAAGSHPGVTFRVAEPLGVDFRLVELILKRVAESERVR